MSTPPGPNPYAYSPYGTPYPARPDPPPTVRRPRRLVVAPLLMFLAALPFLCFGALFLLRPVDTLAQEVLASPSLQQAGATLDLVVSAIRVLGVIVLVVAVLYLLAGLLAVAGRRWARIVVAVLSAGFALLLMAALVAGGRAIDTITVACLLLILVVGAVAILFSPGTSAWYAARR